MDFIKSILSRFSKKGIVWQVTITFSLIMLIPSTIITTLYFQLIQNSLIQEAQKNSVLYLQKMDSNVSHNVKMVDNVLQELNFSQEFPYFLDKSNTLSEREVMRYVSNVQHELLNIRNIYPNKFNRIVIYSTNQQIQEYADWSYHINKLYTRDYFREIENSKSQTIYGDIRMYDNSYGNLVKYTELENEEELVLPIYYKIYNLSNGSFVGLIEVDMSLSRLVDTDSLTAENPSVTYLLLDRENKPVFSTNKKLASSDVPLSFQGTSGTCNELISGTDYLAAYDRDSVLGLTCVTLMNKKEVLASTSGIGNVLLFIAVLSLVGIILLTSFAAHVMFRRLGEMARMISQIESGKFDMRIKVQGCNEISSIAKSFNHMAETLQSVIRSMVEKEKAQKEAELNALQAQINPHFLNNTLEGMRMQCEIDENYALANSIEKLGNLLRYSLQWKNKIVTLDDELNNVQNYIAIMKMRFGHKFQYSVSCDAKYLKTRIPKFILQPLVENCFSHAFINVLPPWIILISVFSDGTNLTIRIDDNGTGVEAERLVRIQGFLNGSHPDMEIKKHEHSIGVVNVKQRLDLLCPPGSGLCITNRPQGGTQVSITIAMNAGN